MGLTRFSRLPSPIAFPGYILGSNGGAVRYVCSLGIQDGTQDDIANLLFTSLASGLAACRANRGDVLCVLPGHTESVTTTPTFVAGVRIVGVGNGDERPVFNWTTATSQWAIAVANVSIENCILNLSATAATVTTKAIVVTGAKSRIQDCAINMGASGTQQAAIGIEYGTGSDRSVLDSNDVISTANAAVVSAVKIVAAVDQLRIVGNKMVVGMSATTAGLITQTVAATNIYIGQNVLDNSIASSTKALVGITACTGEVEYNTLYIQAATGGATAAGTLGTWQLTQNFGCAGGAVTGILIGTASS